MVDTDPLEDRRRGLPERGGDLPATRRDRPRCGLAARLLASFQSATDRFTKVMPKDYKRVLLAALAARRRRPGRQRGRHGRGPTVKDGGSKIMGDPKGFLTTAR